MVVDVDATRAVTEAREIDDVVSRRASLVGELFGFHRRRPRSRVPPRRHARAASGGGIQREQVRLRDRQCGLP